MADRAIARRYARAYLELAEEAGGIDAAGKELSQLLGNTDVDRGPIYLALANPSFTLTERRGLIEAVAPRFGMSPMLKNLLCVLLEKGRTGLFPEVVEQFHEFADQKANRTRVAVTTAEALSPALQADVKASFEKITGKTVILEVKVDPSLIGGLVARVAGRVYDASVQTRLELIKQRLLNARTPAQA